jgi:hypothetical protein
LYTYAKEQLDILKNGPKLAETKTADENNVEEVVAEEVTHLAEIIPATSLVQDAEVEVPITHGERPLTELSKEELFEKLQNYKKLLDNGLILQGEYDRLKNEIITYL